MRPHTFTVPKVLINVAGKPMLDHIIDDLVAAGITGVTLIVGYLGDVIEEHVRLKYPNLESHFVPQHEMLGLGHAISLGADIHRKDEQLLIILGDTILRADFRKLLGSRETLLGVKEVDDPRRFGVVELDNSGRITRMLEKPDKPPTNLAIVGVYKIAAPALLFDGLDHIIANDIRTKKEFQLTDALAWMLDQSHEMRPFTIDQWLDCGKPETLFETNRTLLNEIASTQQDGYRQQFPGSVIVPPVFIGSGCTIESSIIGPNAVLGDNCRVDRSALRDCIVGDNAEISRIMLKESLVGSNTLVKGHSLSLNLGDSSTIEIG